MITLGFATPILGAAGAVRLPLIFSTVGPDDAARAARAVGAKITVPMHYDTFPAIRQDPQAFKALCEPAVKVAVLRPGESLEL